MGVQQSTSLGDPPILPRSPPTDTPSNTPQLPLPDWTRAWIGDCQRRGVREVALDLWRTCETVEDRGMVHATAIHLLQEEEEEEDEAEEGRASSSVSSSSSRRRKKIKPQSTSLLQQAREMATPYSCQQDNNAEHDEHLFQVLEFLLRPEDSSHPSITTTSTTISVAASRRAKALWSDGLADQLVRAKQAWDHPSDTILKPSPTTTTTTNATTGVVDGEPPKCLSKWIEQWCSPVSLKEEQWILLLNADDFVVKKDRSKNAVLDTLASNHGEWLQSRVRDALYEWQLESTFPSLFHDIVRQRFWKKVEPQPQGSYSYYTPTYGVTTQCLVFIARAHCAIKNLERDSLESPSLLAKILRCADLLSKRARAIIVHHQNLQGLAATVPERPRDDSNHTTLDRPTNKRRIMNEPKSSGLLSVEEEEEPAAKVRRISDDSNTTTPASTRMDGDTTSTSTPSVTDTRTAIPSPNRAATATQTPLVVDPYAAALLKTVLSYGDFLRLFPVERLDLKTGDVLNTFPSAHVAMLSLEPVTEVDSKQFLLALLGLRGTSPQQTLESRAASQHSYFNAFWRVHGSLALPCGTYLNRQLLGGEDKSHLPLESTLLDRYVAARIKSGRSLKSIVQDFPVEQLDPNTGEILGRFNNCSEAVSSVYPEQSPDHMIHHALLSYHVSHGRLLGHIYKGYFWRFKGSVSSPTDTPRFFTSPEAPISPKASTEVPTATVVARTLDHPTTTTTTCNQSFGGGANASVELSVRGHGGRGDDEPSSDHRDCTKEYLTSAIDPFAAAQIKSGRILEILVCVDPVEQLDLKTGDILGRFNNLQEAVDWVYPELKNFYQIKYAVLGYRVSQDRLMGHVYEGYFWRLKGSVSSPKDPPRMFPDGSHQSDAPETRSEDPPRISPRLHLSDAPKTRSDVSTIVRTIPPQLPSAMIKLALDPFVVAQIRAGRLSDTIVKTNPVEQLDPKTGKIIGLFKNLEEAIARTCPEQQGLSDLGHAVLGYRVAGGKFMGHMFQGVFWRWTGSAASPFDPPPDFPPQNALNAIPNSKASSAAFQTVPHRNTTGPTYNEAIYRYGMYCINNANTSNNYYPLDPFQTVPHRNTTGTTYNEAIYGMHWINNANTSNNYGPLDPFVAAQIKSGRRLTTIMMTNPVEQLDPKTGKIIGIFKNLQEAIARTCPGHQGLLDLESAVLGYRVAEGRFVGHLFQGCFWRFKGSVTSPTGPPPRISPPLDASNTTNSVSSSTGCTVHRNTTSTSKDPPRLFTAPTAPIPSFTEVTLSTTLRAAVHPSTATHTSNNEPDEDSPNAPVMCAVHDHGERGDDKNSTLDATADDAVRHGEEDEEDDWYADV